MPARFPYKPLIATEASESQAQPDVQPGCRLLAQRPGGRYTWALGDSYILKDRRYEPGAEVEIQNASFVAGGFAGRLDLPQIPQVEVCWRDGDRFFIVQRRVEGESLEHALPTLGPDDIARIGDQVGQSLLHLKIFISAVMAKLDGRPVDDFRLLKPLPDSSSGSYSVCRSDSDLASMLGLSIANRLDKPTFDAFMARMPSGKPFTFSHSDVHEGNIMVKDGNFSGLTNWELAGFYPSWWEYVNSCPLLSPYFPTKIQDHEALKWFRVYHAIRDGPDEEVDSRVNGYLEGRAWEEDVA
ncbi:kinase-like protein [Daldinia bambusicola]|nr:kinase-like protein [Daldinia bambusicola]